MPPRINTGIKMASDARLNAINSPPSHWPKVMGLTASKPLRRATTQTVMISEIPMNTPGITPARNKSATDTFAESA